jgi:hypothetical protein
MAIEGISAAEWARLAGLPNPNSLYNLLNRRAHVLRSDTLEKLASAFPGCTVSELMGEISLTKRSLHVVTVKITAAGGRWRDMLELPLDQQYEVPVPEVADVDYGVKVSGRHADAIVADGAHVMVQEWSNFTDTLRSGDVLLVRRVRNRQSEVTFRQLDLREETPGQPTQALLWFRSSDPAFQGAITMPWPFRGEPWSVGGERHHILGVAVLRVDGMRARRNP